MDIDYAIYFELYAFYTKKNIRIILETAKRLQLFSWEDYLENPTIEKAIEILYIPNSVSRLNREFSITMEFEGANWTFIAHCSDTNQLNALFSDFYGSCKKKFEIGKPEHGPPIDAARYIRLLLKLLQDFEIKGINTHIWNC